jgi:chromosome segregation protein
MYFKRLELVGFKSFANKTVINFEPGITAIVGPNGCGKSNILDAIRWVLGEQSPKSLRGDGMIDVVFSGTANAKALGMAEVVLTISDVGEELGTDYNEVSVGRRLYRSGESQYLINRKPCRLKDVVELFMNTGLGLDAYSFIEQGKIDLILSNKPEDRRYLFEEAAGITKFKSDKKVAMRRLEATEDNLARVGDIISEVKRQINSLSRQASKARRYKKTVDNLAQLEVGFLLHKRELIEDELAKMRVHHDGLKSAIENFSGEVSVEEEAIAELRVEQQEHERSYEVLQGRKLELIRQVDRHENNINLCEQRISDIENSRSNNLRQIDVVGDQIKNLEREVAEREEELLTVEEENEKVASALENTEEEFRIMKVNLESDEDNTRQINQKIMALVERQIDLKNRVAGLDERKQAESDRIERFEQGLGEARGKLEQLQGQERVILEKKTGIERQLEELKSNHEQAQSSVRSSNERLTGIRAQVLEVQKNLSESSSQLEMLRHMKQRYEGYDQGVKNVLEEAAKESGDIDGVMRTLAESLRVRPGFEVAVETVLDRFVQCVIIDSEDNLMKAARWLKENGSGKASFAMSAGSADLAASQGFSAVEGDGICGVAIEYLQEESRIPKYVAAILANTLVVNDIDTALRLVREGRDDINIVTMAGEMVFGGEIVTAGSPVDGSASLIMRDSKINELEALVEKFGNELEGLQLKETELAAVIEKSEQEARVFSERITVESRRLSESESEYLRVATVRESLNNEISRGRSDISRTRLELEQMDQKQQRLAGELKEALSEKEGLEGTLKCALEDLRERTEGVSDIQHEVMEMRIKSISSSERITGLTHRIERAREDLDSRLNEIERRKNEVESGNTLGEKLTEEISESRKSIDGKADEKRTLDHDLEKIDAERMEIFGNISKKEELIRERRGRLAQLHENENNANIKAAEKGFEVRSIDDKLLQEYDLTHNDPKAEKLDPDTDWDQVELELSELKRKKESMGTVNLFAIEEQERLEERYNFLEEQQLDLTDAKDDLLQVIAKINTTTKKLFKETFDKVQEEFRSMFKRLFNGGRADLVLVDESDILECGIEIIASPPGKKLQSISLLSGGEKAMTAIALMLSLFSVKPSPFCVLDEVDAPLDESNIGRFLDVIKEFVGSTQFMIVTHNKRTISMADILYGITMEVSGISKVVSVKFKEKAEKVELEPHPLHA